MSHTPGPWVVVDGEIHAGDDHVVCFGHDYDDYGGIGSQASVHGVAHEAEVAANLSLIAAAPTLLAELKSVLAEIEGCLGMAKEQIREAIGSTNLTVLAVKCQRAETAIAKAEGR